jgi:lipopolysaccharide/colanic/teichoic acid biosynthesis glycosyltransferase
MLLVSSPFLAVIMAPIKLTSKRPVIYKQERLGQFGAS